MIKKWQEENFVCRKMKEWISKCTGNNQKVPKEFKMCYKEFRVENNLLKYASHLKHSPLHIGVPKAYGNQIIGRFQGKAGHPGSVKT
ncbi:MAG: hypothetical protein ACTS4Y_01650 [Candidatus Hodgkinia cicadicola]